MAFFNMRTSCPHIGPKLACRRPGTKYCVDLFLFLVHFGTLPPEVILTSVMVAQTQLFTMVFVSLQV